MPFEGWPRVTAYLRPHGLLVNHERIQPVPARSRSRGPVPPSSCLLMPERPGGTTPRLWIETTAYLLGSSLCPQDRAEEIIHQQLAPSSVEAACAEFSRGGLRRVQSRRLAPSSVEAACAEFSRGGLRRVQSRRLAPSSVEAACAEFSRGGLRRVQSRRIQLHKLPARNLACEESKISSKEIKQLPLERCPVPFLFQPILLSQECDNDLMHVLGLFQRISGIRFSVLFRRNPNRQVCPTEEGIFSSGSFFLQRRHSQRNLVRLCQIWESRHEVG